MAGKRDTRTHRLFVDQSLTEGETIECDTAQRNYLLNVLRLGDGAPVLLFNGRDGEWRGVVRPHGRKVCNLEVSERVRSQTDGPDITLLFAPLKRARLDYMVQKATELGVRALQPVITAYTQAERVNLDRMKSNVIEAAEQCGVLRVPEVNPPEKLTAMLDHWDAGTAIVFCDEAEDSRSAIKVLSSIRLPVAVLIGPEGGFSPDERVRLQRMDAATTISLGPRIMRADTAAVAALSLVNAVIGDWQ